MGQDESSNVHAITGQSPTVLPWLPTGAHPSTGISEHTNKGHITARNICTTYEKGFFCSDFRSTSPMTWPASLIPCIEAKYTHTQAAASGSFWQVVMIGSKCYSYVQIWPSLDVALPNHSTSDLAFLIWCYSKSE